MSDAEYFVEQCLRRSGVERLRPTGAGQWVSTCPFHADETPSFSMRAEDGMFVCYAAQCGVRGTLYRFLLNALGYTHGRAKEALENVGLWGDGNPFLLQEKDFLLPPFEERRKSAVNPSEKKKAPPERILGIYAFCPRYLLGRGFQKEILRAWEVGYDGSRECVTFPVRDAEGALVGITKRQTRPGVFYAYAHLGFRRGSVLYGAYRAPKDAILWVTEGPTDALACAQMGLPAGHYAVATLSSQVAGTQISLLAGYRGVVLAFDGDRAGQAARSRVGEALLPRMAPGAVRVARGYPQNCKDPADVLGLPAPERRAFLEQTEDYSLVRLTG